MKVLCFRCRHPNATLLLRPKPGFADQPVPCCDACSGELPDYYIGRFAVGPMPDPVPPVVAKEWGQP